jgi:hypothetical protein
VLPLFFADFVLLMCYIFYLHVRWVLPEIQEPSREYDHGTWCAGASLGNCINDTSAANAYNGIAYNAKITMFDVDISSTENYLNVPSLHNVALPPAYAAGARVCNICYLLSSLFTLIFNSMVIFMFLTRYIATLGPHIICPRIRVSHWTWTSLCMSTPTSSSSPGLAIVVVRGSTA